MALNHRAMSIITLLVTTLCVSAWADDDVLEVHEQNAISYVSGGVGDDEKAQLESAQHNYNLRIMNADRSGHFSGDIRILISDSQHNLLLDATSGPLFYANLPKGHYIIEGYAGLESKKETVTIAAGKPARVRFMWPEEIEQTNNY
jgi:hypothetical protein